MAKKKTRVKKKRAAKKSPARKKTPRKKPAKKKAKSKTAKKKPTTKKAAKRKTATTRTSKKKKAARKKTSKKPAARKRATKKSTSTPRKKKAAAKKRPPAETKAEPPPAQTVEQTSINRAIGIGHDAIGNAIISGEGNEVVIYQTIHQAAAIEQVEPPPPKDADIGPSPYKGLVAFDENDADRFFGREEQTARLWETFRDIYERSKQQDGFPRLLPILGPSGSGKSSLARAGLIPEFARRPLPGLNAARVAALKPSSHPLESLAAVLARIVTNDPAPVAKTRELAAELQRASDGQYDGLARIAALLPGIATSPLIVMIDQFEEVFSLCEAADERRAFIENLLCASTDPSGNVSVVITLRTDFLGETQKHSRLNNVVAKQGVIIPAMTEAELRRAIAEPARLAGHPLDDATIDLLVEETAGRQGALPLLQFALTRIWEGMRNGVDPPETLKSIGGVGGALAGEAQRIYDGLNSQQKRIARRMFLNLIQLGEGTRDTRRRAPIEDIVGQAVDPEEASGVVLRFSGAGARLITVSADAEGEEMAEVTHESLFEHWELLREWIDEGRDDLRFLRRLEQAARHWEKNGRAAGLLWRPPDLDVLRKFHARAKNEMSRLQVEFFEQSEQQYQEELQRERSRKLWIRFAAVLIPSVLAILCLVAVYAYMTTRDAREKAELSFAQARGAVNDFFTEVSEETLLEEPGMQSLRDDLLNQARRYYETFLEERKGDPSVEEELAETKSRLGRIDEMQGRYREALELYEAARVTQQRLAKVHPDDHRHLYNLGRTLNAEGNVLEKLDELDQALAKYREAENVRTRLVKQFPDQNQLEFQRTLANTKMNIGIIFQSIPDSYAGLAPAIERLAAAETKFKEAADLDDEADGDGSDDPVATPESLEDAKCLIGVADQRLKRWRKLLSSATGAPQDARQQFEAAIQQFAQELQRLKKNVALHQRLIKDFDGDIVELARRQHQEAQDVRLSLEADQQAKDGNEAEVDAGLGPVLLRDIGIGYFNLAVLSADDTETAEKHYRESQNYFKRSLKLDTKNSDTRFQLANSYYGLGYVKAYANGGDQLEDEEYQQAHRQLSQAEEEAQKLAVLNPSVSKYQDLLARIRYELGSLYRRHGKLEEAENAFKLAARGLQQAIKVLEIAGLSDSRANRMFLDYLSTFERLIDEMKQRDSGNDSSGNP